MKRQKKYCLPIQLIELEHENYHILIESKFQNGETGKWTIDTGASKSVFDANLKQLYLFPENSSNDIQSVGIGEMQIQTQAGLIAHLQFGEHTLKDWPVALIDLEHVNKLYSQFTNESIVGLLGSDFMVNHNANIDYRKLTLTLYV